MGKPQFAIKSRSDEIKKESKVHGESKEERHSGAFQNGILKHSWGPADFSFPEAP